MTSPTSTAEVIAKDMRALPLAARKTIRPKLRQAGEGVASEARRRSSWSSRIPGTVHVQASFRVEREQVDIKAGGRGAPHARPYEDTQGRGFFRHPVYGDIDELMRKRWTWVNQVSRPFLAPAAAAKGPEAERLLLVALSEAAATVGFH